MFDFEKKIFAKFIRVGQLSIRFENGEVVGYGDGSGNQITITCPKKSTLSKIMLDPEWQIPMTYIEGKWQLLNGDLTDFLILLRRNAGLVDENVAIKWKQWIERINFRFSQINNPFKSRINVKKHYDLDEESLNSDFYKAFLDPDLYYSCAFFNDGDDLSQAQKNKVQTTISRLKLNQSGMKVLDIGCGWGGLSREIAKVNAAQVTGITLSKKQFQLSTEKATENCNYELIDYRKHQGEYDRIVSVGMFEHVGLSQYAVFFNKVHQLLKTGGTAVIHSIIRERPNITSKWIRKKIFPGGYIPSVSEMLAGIEKTELRVDAIHLHHGSNYMKTLRSWRNNFEAAKKTGVLNISDEQYRQWFFYFSASEHMFTEEMGFRVAQIVLTKKTLQLAC